MLKSVWLQALTELIYTCKQYIVGSLFLDTKYMLNTFEQCILCWNALSVYFAECHVLQRTDDQAQCNAKLFVCQAILSPSNISGQCQKGMVDDTGVIKVSA